MTVCAYMLYREARHVATRRGYAVPNGSQFCGTCGVCVVCVYVSLLFGGTAFCFDLFRSDVFRLVPVAQEATRTAVSCCASRESLFAKHGEEPSSVGPPTWRTKHHAIRPLLPLLLLLLLLLLLQHNGLKIKRSGQLKVKPSHPSIFRSLAVIPAEGD